MNAVALKQSGQVIQVVGDETEPGVAQGNIRKIAKEVGVSVGTVHGVIKEAA